MTLDEEIKRDLLSYIPEALYDANFDEKLKLYKSFHGEESYRNWYLGFSDISLPYIYKERLTYESITHAISGVVSTPLFAETFDETKFEPYLQFRIYIEVPEALRKNTNFSIVFSIEYDIETTSDMEYVQLGRGDYYDMQNEQLNPDQQKLNKGKALILIVKVWNLSFVFL